MQMIVKKARKRYGQVIQPWLHYVPVQVNSLHLHDSFVFFCGGGNEERTHGDIGTETALAGREWSLKFGGRRTSFLQVRVGLIF